MWNRILYGLVSAFFLAAAIFIIVAFVLNTPSIAESMNPGIYVLSTGGSIGLSLLFSGLFAHAAFSKD